MVLPLQGPSLASHLERDGTQACGQDRNQERQETAIHMLEPVAFIRAPHQVQRQGPCPKQKPQSLLQTHSPEPEVHKVLVCDRPLEKAKGSQSPAPRQGSSSSKRCSAHGRLGQACHGHLGGRGPGNSDAVLGRRKPEREPSAWSPRRVEWRVNSAPQRREEGKQGRPGAGVSQRMGQPLRRLFLRTCRPARVAISNTSRTPSLVLAEHSR